MGIEAECTARIGRKASTGTAHLEGETLSFRGDFRLEIPFERMREVTVEGDVLVVHGEDEARFELGALVAERWLRLIRQPRALFEKLELGPEARVAAVDVTDALFVGALRDRTASVAEGRVPEGVAIILLGVEARDALRKVAILRARMTDAAVLWIIRPKAGKAVSEAELREAVRDAGLAETKVVPFSRTHVAHRCIVPIELRGQVRRRPPILTVPPSAPSLGGGQAVGSGRGGGAKGKQDKPVPRASARPAAPKTSALRPKKRR